MNIADTMVNVLLKDTEAHFNISTIPSFQKGMTHCKNKAILSLVFIMEINVLERQHYIETATRSVTSDIWLIDTNPH